VRLIINGIYLTQLQFWNSWLAQYRYLNYVSNDGSLKQITNAFGNKKSCKWDPTGDLKRPVGRGHRCVIVSFESIRGMTLQL